MSAHLDSQSFYNEHYDGAVSLYSNQDSSYDAIVGSLLLLSLNQPSKAGIQRLESIYEDQDQTEVYAVEKQLFDFEETHVEMLIRDGMVSTSGQEELQWYYFARISPRPLNPAFVRPTYDTTDNFQLHTWIMSDGEMGSSVSSNRLLEYLPLGRDNVELIERYLDDYLQDFLDQNIGNKLWVYLALPEFKDSELLDILGPQLDQIRASLTKFADELNISVDVLNYANWVKGV